MLMLAPAAAVGIATPPSGVAVTVTCAEDVGVSETEANEAESCTAGACCTASVICLVVETPSPVAVTVTVAEATVAAAVALKVNVDVPFWLVSVTGLLLNVDVTPLGNPLVLRLTVPL